MQNFQNSTTLSHFLRCAIFVPYFSAATIELRSKSEVLQVFRDAQMHSPTKTAEEELVVSNFYSGSRMAFVAPLTTFRRRTQQRLSCKSIGSKPVSWTLAAPRRSAVVASIGLASVDEAQNQSEELGEHLVRAAMLNDVQGVANALREGAAPNYASAKGGSNMTALMWATSNGSVEITSMLLSAGLTREDINAKNASDFTATLYCFDNLPSANPRPAPPSGFPNAVNFNRPTPPQVRIEKKATGHSNCAKLLLMNGADLFVVNMYNEGLLHMAARKGQLDWLRILVDKGLPLNARNKGYMNTPVILAAIENHADCVRYLCEQEGSDVNAQNVVGWTALTWAAAMGSVESVEALLESKADPNIVGQGAFTSDGQALKTTALQEGRKSSEARKVSKLLIGAGAIE